MTRYLQYVQRLATKETGGANLIGAYAIELDRLGFPLERSMLQYLIHKSSYLLLDLLI